MSAMVLLLAVLSLFAVAYRYYSAFLAAKVMALDDSRVTPAERLADGQNFEPTNKWVLFGHHFAAISGAGPLIGPVLAAQFGYLPGLLWIVIGVCIGGAVQDFLVMAMSVRRDGQSLARIAFAEINRTAGWAATLAILLIVVVALAGLGKVVVKALGGESVNYPAGSVLTLPAGGVIEEPKVTTKGAVYAIPPGSTLTWGDGQRLPISEAFGLMTPAPVEVKENAITLPKGSVRLVPGSSWGTFTIAMTIPIALFVGLYMYKLRPGKVVEASIIGGLLTLAATVAGGWVAEHPLGHFFELSSGGVTWAMAIYGFVAAVLPVWVLLCPRDYLSSFLKIGTILLLVGGVLLANPRMEAPAVNSVFLSGGPTVRGSIFPFLFITVMCGAISGFHSLVSSGTTPKMVKRESHTRMIGYGAMLMEGLVAVVAMIAAATLPVRDYYAMNTELDKVPAYHERILQVAGAHGVEDIALYEALTQESLRGRTGGAVTLAVGMAHIFDSAAQKISSAAEHELRSLWKYWYHFAIMFEALFILTTIDAGTRIARFLLQEVLGRLHPALRLGGGWWSAVLATAAVVLAWASFMNSDSFATIWAVFGISNQMLAAIALAVVTVYLSNAGKQRYLWVTLVPMGVVFATTWSASVVLLLGQISTIHTQLAQPPSGATNWTLVRNAGMQAGILGLILGLSAVVVAGALWKVRWRGVGDRLPAAAAQG